MKITKLLALILVSAIILASALLASCEGKTADTESASDTAEATGTVGSDTGTDVETETETETETEKETEKANFDALSLETVSEEFDSSMIGEKFTTKSYKFIKNNLFKSKTNGFSYNWYEFYNACVTGVLDVKSEESLAFIEKCLPYFEEFGLEDEISQARALAEAAK